MIQTHKKRPPRATANSPRFCWIWEKLLYKSGKFIYGSIVLLLTYFHHSPKGVEIVLMLVRQSHT